MWWINTYRWDLADLGALIAPRPLLIGSADKDGIFTIESIRQIHSQLRGLYRKLGAEENLRLVETPGGHSYHERSRTEIFSWFIKHLMGREIAPAEVGRHRRASGEAGVGGNVARLHQGLAAGNRTATHSGRFPSATRCSDDSRCRSARARTRAGGRRAASRKRSAPSRPNRRRSMSRPNTSSTRMPWAIGLDSRRKTAGACTASFSAASNCRHQRPPSLPCARLYEGRSDTRGFLMRLNAPWVRIGVETARHRRDVMGRGLELASPSRSRLDRTHHSPRCACGIRSAPCRRRANCPRSIERTFPSRHAAKWRRRSLCRAARRQRPHGFPRNPAGQPERRRAKRTAAARRSKCCNCLRITDLPQVAGLLWPAELVFIGATPPTYDWAEELYRKLGPPGRVSRVKDVREWKPA